MKHTAATLGSYSPRATKQEQAADLLENSLMSYRQIADHVGCSLQTVRIAAWVLRGKREAKRRIAP